MNLRGSRGRDDPEINFIPLIDVLLVILIFLMVTTTYQRIAELQITLPEASADPAEDWYRPRRTPLTAALRPLAGVFAIAAALRRALYRAGWLRSTRLAVPVVVVGNVTVGGTGKTPLVRALVQALRARGWRPGIVSRGHGGRVRGVRLVSTVDDAAEVGDEALLLAADAPV